ncbi:MAG: hypothetical protein II230_00020, partial [Clostridia bacterium]|nr:hypothetical protein [Clostridia bacterium]
SEQTLNEIGGRHTFLGVRQTQFDLLYDAQVKLTGENGGAGITVFHTNEHHYDILVKKQGNNLTAQLRRRVVDMEIVSEPIVFENTDSLMLRIDAKRLRYTFLAGKDAGTLVVIGTGSSQLLSTEAMICTFTGCFAGMFAEGDVKANFTYFSAQEN